MGFLVTGLALLFGLPLHAAEAPDEAADYAFTQNIGAVLPAGLRFTEAGGRPVALDDLFGRAPVVLALGYFRCPSLCGVVRNDVLEALSKARLTPPADYQLVSVSIDPAETPADAAGALADDRARYPVPGSATGWHYLTGDAAGVAQVAQAVGFHSRYDEHLRQFLHPAGIVVLTPERRVSAYVLGVGYSAGDVGAAVTLARTGLLAQAASPILLLCFNHDAATGRYSLAVMKVLRLGAILTIVTILGTVFLVWRRDRRARAAP